MPIGTGDMLSWTAAAILLMCCCSPSLRVGALVTEPSEVSALQAVKSNLGDPMGMLASWSKGDPCVGQWTGVECFNESGKDGYLHVRELQLLNMNLSGMLSPEIGQLSYLEILDFMWNNIQGSIPKEIGNLKSLRLLLLNGNQLSGPLPEELGYLSKLDRLHVDENNISGPLPKSFENMIEMRHLHMNNNSISGKIPLGIARLPNLVHFLLDNNFLSGYLPPGFSELQNLTVLQVDNNNFSGSSIPQSYGKIKSLLKLSLRNCSLHGTVPDFSEISELTYLDLSWNHLEGSIPSKELSTNVTTIDLSNNKLNGSIPPSYYKLPSLQKLSLSNNSLSDFFPSIRENMTFIANGDLILDFRNNSLSNMSGLLDPPSNVMIMLQGNPICLNTNLHDIVKFCGSMGKEKPSGGSSDAPNNCPPQSCPKEDFFEYIPRAPVPCYCAAPIGVGYRLKSPGFSDFQPYSHLFKDLACAVGLRPFQIYIDSYAWEGPRLRMYLKIFPNLSRNFSDNEVHHIMDLFAEWKVPDGGILGPYDLLYFTLQGPYSNINFHSSRSWKKSAILIIILVTVSGTIAPSILALFIVMRRKSKYQSLISKRNLYSGIKVDGVRQFSLEEIAQATNSFSTSSQIGKGGYGNVYRGVLSDGTVVAVKRAHKDSLQGSKEFHNEIDFLSRLHHGNLVSLVGYCDENSDQMLVYEYMPNGTLRDHLSRGSNEFLDFFTRLKIGLGSARGILYLHNEANPPIFHRDIKASNILLDSEFTAKVADFGLSRFAPTPNDDGDVNGHISTVVRGTPGYIDPEYFLTRKMTNKSDVYSLGVVFLELSTGMPPISHGRNIVREARSACNRSQLGKIIDKRMGPYPQSSVEKFTFLALRCCNGDPSTRPSMREVVRELEDICSTIGVDVSSSDLTVTDSSEAQSEHSISGNLQNWSSHSDLETNTAYASFLHTR